MGKISGTCKICKRDEVTLVSNSSRVCHTCGRVQSILKKQENGIELAPSDHTVLKAIEASPYSMSAQAFKILTNGQPIVKDKPHYNYASFPKMHLIESWTCSDGSEWGNEIDAARREMVLKDERIKNLEKQFWTKAVKHG